MKKLVITLRQQTPLIHFQHDDGATLRASEVKPKLDKFIIEHSNGNSFEYWQQYLVGAFSTNLGILQRKFNAGFRALDYKMRIEPIGKKQIFDQVNENRRLFSLYFGDLDNNSDYKEGVMYNDGIKLYITSHNERLINIIKINIPHFLECTNFGTRQTKGYGSFYIDENDALYTPPNHANYSFRVRGSFNDLFSQIKDFYSIIRAGINDQQGLYVKSALFKYLKDQGIQWDKRTIKQQFLDASEISSERSKHPTEDIVNFESTDIDNKNVIFKELLGLSTTENWVNYGFNISRNHPHKDITRFKSPIIFKPILEFRNNEHFYNVYIYLSEIPTTMRNQSFVIGSSRGSFDMRTSNAFNIAEYFEWIFLNKNTIIDTLSTITDISNRNNPKVRLSTIKTNFEKLTNA